MAKLIQCKTCNAEIATNAKNCPACGAKNKKPIYKKWWVWVIVVVVSLSVAGQGGKDTVQSSANAKDIKQSTSESEPEQSISVTAEQLLEAYNENEVKADSQYKGKVLEVTGIVNTIGKDILDEAYVTVGSGEPYEVWSVQCYFGKGDLDSISELSPGDTVTISGKCSGKTLNVALKQCTVK
jgi:RNA polymerase subunit RPABC4/transcription elongation factor Spt4